MNIFWSKETIQGVILKQNISFSLRLPSSFSKEKMDWASDKHMKEIKVSIKSVGYFWKGAFPLILLLWQVKKEEPIARQPKHTSENLIKVEPKIFNGCKSACSDHSQSPGYFKAV